MKVIFEVLLNHKPSIHFFIKKGELIEVEGLINKCQLSATLQCKAKVLQILRTRREEIKLELKFLFNKNFGSVFRAIKEGLCVIEILQKLKSFQ